MELHSLGAYGIVYRALRLGQEEAGPVALKLAIHPWDPRFAREAELLRRIHHPHIPRLLDQGVWRSGSRLEHPYLVMEWIDGIPLYDWARRHAPPFRQGPQVTRVLACMARALEATHAARALHRDVKGDNVLVRHSDGSAVLTDFGSGHFEGASRLTWQPLPPGTPAYRSPEANLFLLCSVRAPHVRFESSPADDLFALGVTAYRLVTGEYPPAAEPLQDEAGHWRIVPPDPRTLFEHHPQVEPRLQACILRLLSADRAARGTAAELAQALEASAAPGDSRRVPRRERSSNRAHLRKGSGWKVLAAAGLASVVVWGMQATLGPDESALACTQDSRLPDTGTSAVGDSAPATSMAAVQGPDSRSDIAQDPLPEPRAGQIRVDEKGRCPGRKQLALNGGCWVGLPTMDSAECRENGYVLHRGKCYAPALQPPRQPQRTSTPSDSP